MTTAANPVDAATSFLFVPGTRHDRFAKAADSGADVVIVDLEDAVAPADKVSARTVVAGWCDANACVVRINGAATPWHDDDIDALAGAPELLAVMVPKAESIEQVESVASAVGVAVIALVETARGVLHAAELASSPAVARLAFGNLDFAADCGITPGPDELELLAARSALVVASRAAGLPGPVDGVFTQVGDLDGLGAAVGRARRLGFAGTLCIHPEQVAVVSRRLGPSTEEIDWARRVLAASAEHGAATLFVLDGNMVDEPVLRRARAIVAQVAPTTAGSR
ncbi:MAG: HpcH/HpaI aldolase/citrate lyase family protein [Desertimonas sp.]